MQSRRVPWCNVAKLTIIFQLVKEKCIFLQNNTIMGNTIWLAAVFTVLFNYPKRDNLFQLRSFLCCYSSDFLQKIPYYSSDFLHFYSKKLREWLKMYNLCRHKIMCLYVYILCGGIIKWLFVDNLAFWRIKCL